MPADGHGSIHNKRQGKRGSQGGDEGNRIPPIQKHLTSQNYSGGHRQGARGEEGGGHSGCWHPNRASSSLELDVFWKRGKSMSPTEYSFSKSFMNGCKKTKTRIQVQTPTKDLESQKLGLGWFSVVRRSGG
jgi:hypothetical protein